MGLGVSVPVPGGVWDSHGPKQLDKIYLGMVLLWRTDPHYMTHAMVLPVLVSSAWASTVVMPVGQCNTEPFCTSVASSRPRVHSSARCRQRFASLFTPTGAALGESNSRPARGSSWHSYWAPNRVGDRTGQRGGGCRMRWAAGFGSMGVFGRESQKNSESQTLYRRILQTSANTRLKAYINLFKPLNHPGGAQTRPTPRGLNEFTELCGKL